VKENPKRVNADNIDAIIKKMEGVSDYSLHKQQIRFLVRYLVKNKSQHTQPWLIKAKKLAEQFNDDDFTLSIMISEDHLMEHFVNNEASKKNKLKCLQFAKKTKNYDGAQGVLVGLGYNATNEGNHKQAYQYFQEAIDYALKTGRQQSVYGNKGHLMVSVNNMGNTEEALLLANEIITNSNDISEPLARAYSILGRIAFKAGEIDKAILNFSKATETFLTLNQKYHFALDNLSLAEVLLEANKLNGVEEKITLSLEIFTLFKSHRYINYSQLVMAQYFAKNKNYKKAIKIVESIDLHQLNEIKETELVIDILLKSIKWHIDANNTVKTKRLLEQLECYLEKSNDNSKRLNYHKLASQFFSSHNEYEKAFAHLSDYQKLYAASFNEERNKKIAELETKFELTKKQQEAEKHKLEKMAFQQMALRAQMNPHFIFNALNSVQKHIVNKNNVVAATYLAKFSKLMRKILETSEEPYIPLDKLIEMLEDYIKIEQLRFNDSFKYTITLDDDIDEDMIEVPAMIIQPYVENAIIHGIGEKEDGLIELKFSLVDDDTIQCVITDNGVGITSTKEKFAHHHKSMGTKITKDRIQTLAEQLNRKIEVNTTEIIENDIIKGTKVVLTLPIL